MTEHQTPAASGRATFDVAAKAVVITDLTITDTSVVAEARRWSTGIRGASLAVDELAGADLRAFVSQALIVGSQAIALAGGAQDTFELERLVTEVGAKTAAAGELAAVTTVRAAASAAEALAKAAESARKALTETEAASRKSYAETVAASTKALRDELERLVGGERPELLAKLGPVIEAAGRTIAEQGAEHTDKLLDKVSRQFNPDDPTSPFARQAKSLADQQQTLTESMTKNHLALVGKVDQLATAVEAQKAAAAAVSRTASVTPLKGGTFETDVSLVMDGIAVGLGDEYAETGRVAGAIPRCFKGDGLLTVAGGTARVVVEMHDSLDRRVWNDYLDEAERNREAAASIGIVRTPAQNKGETVRVLGSRRLVLAYDPAVDAPDLLRTVVQLVRAAAVAASSRRDVEGLETAEEHLAAARELLDRINTIRKASGSIRKGADTIDHECNTVQTGIDRHLGQALDALVGVALEAQTSVADAAVLNRSASGAA